MLADKRLQYAALEKLGAAVPRTIVPETPDEAVVAVGELGLPCIVKPAVSDLWTLTRSDKLKIARAQSFAVLSWRDPGPALSMLRRAVWPMRPHESVTHTASRSESPHTQ